MKRYGDLYRQIVMFENLFTAYRKAAKGKRGLPNVARFEFDLEANLLRLQAELQAHTYRPGAYYSFHIRDPKRRLISAAPFRDRVVHHALCNVIEPLFEQTFIGDSYANRKGKGTHAALDRAQSFARRYPYVLQCDIRQFFPSIDLTILRNILARKLADAETMGLIDLILAGGAGVLCNEYEMVYFPGDDLFAATRPRGLLSDPVPVAPAEVWWPAEYRSGHVPHAPAPCPLAGAARGQKPNEYRERCVWRIQPVGSRVQPSPVTSKPGPSLVATRSS